MTFTGGNPRQRADRIPYGPKITAFQKTQSRPKGFSHRQYENSKTLLGHTELGHIMNVDVDVVPALFKQTPCVSNKWPVTVGQNLGNVLDDDHLGVKLGRDLGKIYKEGVPRISCSIFISM